MFSTQKELKEVITYVGWVGHGNIGDEALYLVNKKLFNQYRLVPTLNEKYSKVSLLGGGTLLPSYPVSMHPNKYNYAIGVGMKNPTFWGPFDSFTKEMVKRHRFRFLGVRGNISKELLRNIGIESQVVGDPCLLLEPNSYKKKNNRLIAVNVGVSPDGIWGNGIFLLKEAIEFCKRLKADGYQLTLIPFWKGDLPYIKKLSEAADIDIFGKWSNIQKVLDFIASCYVLIGQKLHSVIFSAATYTPFICMEYRPKCLDFTESVGFEKCTIRTDQINALKLMRLFCDLLDNWIDMRNMLIKKVERYRKSLRQSVAQIIKDIESLPEDKWTIPGTVYNIESRIFWGSEFFLYNKTKSLWNAWNSLLLRKYVNYFRNLILFA